jgi:hypothetical protein
MKEWLERAGGVFLGLAAALVSTSLVFGSIILALTEGGVRLALSPPSTSISFDAGVLIPTPTVSPPQDTPFPGQPTFTPTSVSLPTEIPTLTLPPPPANCPPPEGWMPVTLAPGDTLRILAGRYDTTQESLAEANCLITSRLIAGSILYVPAPSPTALPVDCGPPPGWVSYTVRPGDTLFQLSLTFGVSVSQLQRANCMGDATGIFAGQRLFTPFLPPAPPNSTTTPTLPLATEPVPSPEPPTATSSETSQPPTSTATPSQTPTLFPSITSSPTETPTPSDTPTPTDTPTPSNSPPEISPLSNLSTGEDVTAGPIAFTVGDPETPPAELQVLASSSDAALLPESGIITGGFGSERSMTLIPAADQSGTVTVTITVKDTWGGQTSVTFDLSVLPVNDHPVAQDDASSSVQDNYTMIFVLANDYDVDGDLLQVSATSDPAHGSVVLEGDYLIYSPDPGYSGEDSFTYTVTDGNLESNAATVTVTIIPPD